MKLIFAGTPEFAATALARLLTTDHEIVAVYTQPDRPAGRGRKLTASPVKQLAEQHGLPVCQPLHFRAGTDEGEAAREQLAALGADVMVVAAYGLILPQAVLDMPRYGCLNIHASILPRWRGAAPIQRAILAGDTVTGVTIMQMARGLDTGDMLLTVTTPIGPQTTAAGLHDTLADLGAEALLTVLASEATLQQYQASRTVQDEAQTCYADKLSKAEAQIDWQQPAVQIDRQVRAFNPVPVAFFQLDQSTAVRVWQAEWPQDAAATAARAGQILAVSAEGIDVACGEGQQLRLTHLQWPGGKPLTALQVMQSRRLAVGQVLGQDTVAEASHD